MDVLHKQGGHVISNKVPVNGSFNALHLSCTVDYIWSICVNGFVVSIRPPLLWFHGNRLTHLQSDKMTMNVCSWTPPLLHAFNTYYDHSNSDRGPQHFVY